MEGGIEYMGTNGTKMIGETINEAQYKCIKKDCTANGNKNTCTGVDL